MASSSIKADAAAIELLQDTAVRASKASELELPVSFKPTHIEYVAKPDGTVEKLTAEPYARLHGFETLAALIAFAQAVLDGKHGAGTKPVVWYSRESVAVIVDDAIRRDRGILPLRFTPQLQVLDNGDSSAPQQQADFVRFLRIQLDGTLPPDSNFLSIVREIKFGNAMDGHGTINHGKESMGKEINAHVLGTGAIPKTITLLVRIFDSPDICYVHPIKCAVDVLVHEQMFRLVPLPMQIPDAVARAMQVVGKELSSLKCPIYEGSQSYVFRSPHDNLTADE